MISSRKVPPGGEGKIKASLSTHGRRGQLNKSIVVYSNDPKQSRFVLRFKGKVAVQLALSPERTNLRRIGAGTIHEKKLELIGQLAADARILNAQTSDKDRLIATVTPDGKSVQVKLKAGKRLGRFFGTVSVTVDKARDKRPITAHFWAQVEGDIALDKHYLYFRPYKKGARNEIVAELRSRSKKPFRVLRAQEKRGNVKIAIKRRGPDRWQLKMRLVRKPVLTRGAILIHTDRAEQKLISVNYGVRMNVRF
jgi:hypothetical protein